LTESVTAAALTGVGQELAAAREARGLALADVAQQLKFAPRQLEALEQEQFGALPGATFAKGMVRSYARLLKLDPEPLLQRVAGHFEVPDSGRLAARYHQPVPFSDSARKSTFVYLGLSAGVLVLVGAVAYEWHQERSAKRQIAFVAAAKAPLEPPRTAAPSTPPAPPKTASPPSAPRTAAQTAKATAKVAEVTPAAEERAAPLPPIAAGVHRIVVRCDEECWIEVKDGLERHLVSSLNPAGTERVVRGQPPFEIVIGNAQHVRVTYNDRPIDLQPHTRVEVARFTLQ